MVDKISRTIAHYFSKQAHHLPFCDGIVRIRSSSWSSITVQEKNPCPLCNCLMTGLNQTIRYYRNRFGNGRDLISFVNNRIGIHPTMVESSLWCESPNHHPVIPSSSVQNVKRDDKIRPNSIWGCSNRDFFGGQEDLAKSIIASFSSKAKLRDYLFPRPFRISTASRMPALGRSLLLYSYLEMGENWPWMLYIRRSLPRDIQTTEGTLSCVREFCHRDSSCQFRGTWASIVAPAAQTISIRLFSLEMNKRTKEREMPWNQPVHKNVVGKVNLQGQPSNRPMPEGYGNSEATLVSIANSTIGATGDHRSPSGDPWSLAVSTISLTVVLRPISFEEL